MSSIRAGSLAEDLEAVWSRTWYECEPAGPVRDLLVVHDEAADATLEDIEALDPEIVAMQRRAVAGGGDQFDDLELDARALSE